MPVQYTGILDEHKAVRERGGHLRRLAHGRGLVPRAARRRGGAAPRHQRRRQARRRRRVYTCACLPTRRHRRRPHRLPRPTATTCLIVFNASQRRQRLRLVQRAGGRRCASSSTCRTRPALIARAGAEGGGAGAVARATQPVERAASRSPPRTATIGGVKAQVGAHRLHRRGRLRALLRRRASGASCGTRCSTRATPAALKPIGLGARDTLAPRGAPLALRQRHRRDHTPLEAGLGWVVKPTRASSARRRSPSRRPRGLHAQARRLRDEGARHRAPRLPARSTRAARRSASCTSGSLGPTVGKNIGLGYVPAALARAGHAAARRLPRQVARAPKSSRRRSTSAPREPHEESAT